MRAETERLVDEIEKSLALLRQRLGWETAEHRLEELNAMTEDPALWNDPARAQKLMRDRQTLADALDGYKRLAQELADQQELIELGEAEGDDGGRRRRRGRDPRARATGGARRRPRRCSTARPTATTPSSRSTPAPAAPRAATGRRCSRACTSAGPRRTA